MEKPDLIHTVDYDLKNSRSNFNIILDEACQRLWKMRISYSIEKVAGFKRDLDLIEEELEHFIRTREISIAEGESGTELDQ